MDPVSLQQLSTEFTDAIPTYSGVLEALDDKERLAVAYVHASSGFVEGLAKELAPAYEAIFRKPLNADLLRGATMATAIRDRKGAILGLLVMEFVWSRDEDSRLGGKIMAQGVRAEYKGFGLSRALFDATEIFLACFIIDKDFDEQHELALTFQQLRKDERSLYLVAPCNAASKKRQRALSRHGFARTDSDWGQADDDDHGETFYERELHLLVFDEDDAF